MKESLATGRQTKLPLTDKPLAKPRFGLHFSLGAGKEFVQKALQHAPLTEPSE